MKITRIISYIIIVLIILLGITFAVRNDIPVVLDYYLGTTKIPLSLLMVYCLGVGIILGLIVITFPLFKLKRQNRHLRSQIKKMEKDQAAAKAVILNN